MIVTILAPPVAVFMVAGQPVIAMAFGRGDFTGDDVERTARALLWYAPAVLALGWREIASRSFYAVGDARTPVIVAVGAMALNVVGDLTLGRKLGIPGLAASTTLAFEFAAVATTVLLSRRQQASFHPALMTLGRVGLGAGAGSLLATALLRASGLAEDVDGAGRSALAQSGVAVAAVSVGYLGVLKLLGAPELHLLNDTLRLLTRRLRRSSS